MKMKHLKVAVGILFGVLFVVWAYVCYFSAVRVYARKVNFSPEEWLKYIPKEEVIISNDGDEDKDRIIDFFKRPLWWTWYLRGVFNKAGKRMAVLINSSLEVELFEVPYSYRGGTFEGEYVLERGEKILLKDWRDLVRELRERR